MIFSNMKRNLLCAIEYNRLIMLACKLYIYHTNIDCIGMIVSVFHWHFYDYYVTDRFLGKSSIRNFARYNHASFSFLHFVFSCNNYCFMCPCLSPSLWKKRDSSIKLCITRISEMFFYHWLFKRNAASVKNFE